MHLHLLHSLHDPVDSRGTQDDRNPGGKPAGVIQDKNNLLFIIVGHVFDLNPHQGEAQMHCLLGGSAGHLRQRQADSH